STVVTTRSGAMAFFAGGSNLKCVTSSALRRTIDEACTSHQSPHGMDTMVSKWVSLHTIPFSQANARSGCWHRSMAWVANDLVAQRGSNTTSTVWTADISRTSISD